MVGRRSVSFDDDVLKLIDDYRRKQNKIPSFSKTVNELIKKGAKIEFQTDRVSV